LSHVPELRQSTITGQPTSVEHVNARLTDGSVHGARGNVLAGRVETRCKDLPRMACELHHGRLQCAATRALHRLSAHCSFSVLAFQIARFFTYRLNQRAIPRAIRYGDRGASLVGIWLCALHQLARAKGVLRRALSSGHCDCGFRGGFPESKAYAVIVFLSVYRCWSSGKLSRRRSAITRTDTALDPPVEHPSLLASTTSTYDASSTALFDYPRLRGPHTNIHSCRRSIKQHHQPEEWLQQRPPAWARSEHPRPSHCCNTC
jgi:hypothetical protein